MPILLVLISLCTYGQSKFEAGLKAGMNATNANSDGREGANLYGLYGVWKFAKFGVQPEVHFSNQVSRAAIFSFEEVKYINFPVIFKRYLVKGFNVQAGPQFGILVDGGLRDFQYKKTDFGTVLGLGWDSKFGVDLEFRYIHGLKNVDSGIVLNNFPKPNRNRHIQFSIGYRLFRKR